MLPMSVLAALDQRRRFNLQFDSQVICLEIDHTKYDVGTVSSEREPSALPKKKPRRAVFCPWNQPGPVYYRIRLKQKARFRIKFNANVAFDDDLLLKSFLRIY